VETGADEKLTTESQRTQRRNHREPVKEKINK
jgi:hypothetical protein